MRWESVGLLDLRTQAEVPGARRPTHRLGLARWSREGIRAGAWSGHQGYGRLPSESYPYRTRWRNGRHDCLRANHRTKVVVQHLTAAVPLAQEALDTILTAAGA